MISYWLSYRSEVSCIGPRPKAEVSCIGPRPKAENQYSGARPVTEPIRNHLINNIIVDEIMVILSVRTITSKSYSKTRVKRPLKDSQNKDLNDKW